MRTPWIACVVVMVAGCSPSAGDCSPGLEGCPCTDEGLCLSGLDCRSNLCVQLGTPMEDGGTAPGTDGGGTTPGTDGGGTTPGSDGGPPETMPNPDAFWEMDPPPMQCLRDGTMGPLPDPPGGTPECPDDKNREGCRCDEVGATAPCWPGLRANRDRGICRDGVTTCQPFDEFGGTWGACQGAVLPVEGVELGPSACGCFSQGRWEIDNLSPCFIEYSSGRGIYAVSTYVASDGGARCPDLPTNASPPPAPQAGESWSANRLTVDCEGSFRLCYTLKAGDADAPTAGDCTVTEVCTDEIWYEERDVVQELPALPGWTSTDPACAQAFRDSGGYGEMSVVGRSVECDAIDDGSGGRYVFNRVNYCPTRCNTDPTGPGCESCMMGGSGSF
ncbi:MAG: hypothetical protein AB8I08_31265 [Sandaracinaceae bacterium]